MTELVCLIGLILMMITIYLDRKRHQKEVLNIAITYHKQLVRFSEYLKENELSDDYVKWEGER